LAEARNGVTDSRRYRISLAVTASAKPIESYLVEIMQSLNDFVAASILKGSRKRFSALHADYLQEKRETQMEHPKTAEQIAAELEARLAELEQRVAALEQAAS